MELPLAYFQMNVQKCDEKNCSVRRLLLQQPHVFAVGLVWSTPNPSAQEIVEMLNVISLQIRLSNIFDGVPVQVRTSFVLKKLFGAA